MKTALRIILVVFVILISRIYLSILISPRLISGSRNNSWLPNIICIVIALGIGLIVWKGTGKGSSEPLSYILKGGVIIGVIAFVLGFVGPIIFTPENNLGPLMGLIYAGPAGFIIGLFAGGLYWYFKVREL